MLSVCEVYSSTSIEMLVLYDIVCFLYNPQIWHSTGSVVGVKTAESDFALLLPSVLMRKMMWVLCVCKHTLYNWPYHCSCCYLLVSFCRGLVLLVLGWSMWVLWWMKWYWDRLSPITVISLLLRTCTLFMCLLIFYKLGSWSRERLHCYIANAVEKCCYRKQDSWSLWTFIGIV